MLNTLITKHNSFLQHINRENSLHVRKLCATAAKCSTAMLNRLKYSIMRPLFISDKYDDIDQHET